MTDEDDCPPCDLAKRDAVKHICRIAGDREHQCNEDLLSILDSIKHLGVDEAKRRFLDEVRKYQPGGIYYDERQE